MHNNMPNIEYGTRDILIFSEKSLSGLTIDIFSNTLHLITAKIVSKMVQSDFHWKFHVKRPNQPILIVSVEFQIGLSDSGNEMRLREKQFKYIYISNELYQMTLKISSVR